MARARRPVFFFIGSAFAVALYALRRADSPLTSAWLALAAALLLAAIACVWRARRAFYSAAEARVLLESELRLDTRLTAAASGLVAWPAVPAPFPAVVRWRLRAPGGWLLATAALLALAVWAPVYRDAAATHAAGPPPSLLAAGVDARRAQGDEGRGARRHRAARRARPRTGPTSPPTNSIPTPRSRRPTPCATRPPSPPRPSRAASTPPPARSAPPTAMPT